ncbi:zinc transporter SLC39A7 [Corvus hawaiiensis]|uniref:zinc transporter SLC39A7 n=1 Tax=Corvus hawaiiensis TaxID=134902 RepID=UPI00201A085B|nr:zinc transporter SLC39A7 [Corvus hawaiiensis]
MGAALGVSLAPQLVLLLTMGAALGVSLAPQLVLLLLRRRWGAALGVSLAPQLVLLLVPADSGSPRRRGLLRLLLSFAAGGAAGDAFLHLIPHALAPHEHHEGHGHSQHGHGESPGHPGDTLGTIWGAPHEHHEGHGHSQHGHAPHEHHEGHGHSQHGHAPHVHHEGHGHSQHGHAPHEHHEGHGHSQHGHVPPFVPAGPHEGHGHSQHGHGQALSVGLWVLAGIVTFLGVELGVRHCGGHGHSHGPKAKHSSSEDEADGDARGTKGTKGTKSTKGTKGTKGQREEEPREAMAVSGYLNLAADAAHNFTDGLALGAAFWGGGPVRGSLTALSVLLHELPHELGDMALLLRAGCSKGQAMLLQLVTALAALAGCRLLVCWLRAPGAGAVAGILPFTAGGFIYLGTVSVIPEILRNSGPAQALLQLLALLAGVAMMLLIAHYE